MSTTFIKNKEDFVCEKCGMVVKGGGYTNHCPKCLWSKHVDVNPGDRANSCRGLMRPIGIKKDGQEISLIHECEKCKTRKNNKTAPDDSMEMIAYLSTQPVK